MIVGEVAGDLTGRMGVWRCDPIEVSGGFWTAGQSGRDPKRSLITG